MRFLIIFLFLMSNGFADEAFNLKNIVINKELKKYNDLTFLDDKNNQLNLKDYNGNLILLNFWATWCIPCVQEHQQLIEAANTYKSKGVAFLGILYGDTAEKAREFNVKHGSAYPTLIDDSQRTNIDYGVAGVPETYIIDRDGTIIKKFTGPVFKAELDAVLKELL